MPDEAKEAHQPPAFLAWYVSHFLTIAIILIIILGLMAMAKSFDGAERKFKDDAYSKVFKVTAAGGAIPTVGLLIGGGFDISILAKASDARVFIVMGGLALLLFSVAELQEVFFSKPSKAGA